MKEFDLEAAKAGKKVMTRDGRNVRIVCFDCKDPVKPIVALVEKTLVYEFPERNEKIEEDIVKYSPQGKAGDMNNDLVMAAEKHVYYVNIYENYDARLFYKQLFDTYKEAHDFALERQREDPKIRFVTTTKLEWEE